MLFPFLSATSTAYAKIIPVISILGGPYFSKISEDTTATLASPFTNTYKVDRNWSVNAVGGLFVGGRYWFNRHIGLQLGLAGYYSSRQKVEGVVWQFSDPAFDNFDFHYYVQSKRIMLQTQLMTTFHESFHPYFSFGLGSAFNRAYGYEETPRISTAIPHTYQLLQSLIIRVQ